MGPDRDINGYGLTTEVEPLVGAHSVHDCNALDLVIYVVEHISGRLAIRTLARTIMSC